MSKILSASEFSKCSDVSGLLLKVKEILSAQEVFAVAVMLSELLPAAKILHFMNHETVNIRMIMDSASAVRSG